MKKYAIILTFIMFQSLTLLADAKDVSENTRMKSGTVWKYEQDMSNYAFLDGISKKIYYLTLFIDGTYHQYVHIIPSNARNYFGIRYYELDGAWQYKDNKLFLEENGKRNAIDYDYFNANFENIDNVMIPDAE